jgi:hypothetical protein
MLEVDDGERIVVYFELEAISESRSIGGRHRVAF